MQEISEEYFHLPAVLLWHPMVTHPQFVNQRWSKCHYCGLPVHEGHWSDGSSASTQPRTLHDISNVVLLVSAVYICENNHNILAHDETVLRNFPLQTLIPFVLLHRTGFTRELVDMCTTLVRSGVNFYTMENLILQRRWETYARKQDMFRIHQQLLYTLHHYIGQL